MDDARFSQSQGSSAGGEAGLDYFGATPATPAPVAGPAGPYGPPGPNPFGAPSGYAQPQQPMAPPRRSGGRAKVIIIVVAIIAVLGGIRLWNMHEHARPITLPATFDGQVPNADANAQSLKDSVLTSLRNANPGIAANGQIYGSGKDLVVLMAARGTVDVKKDLGDAGVTTPVQIGDVWCASDLQKTFIACERTGSGLTVFVLAESGTQDITASLVDSAYGQF